MIKRLIILSLTISFITIPSKSQYTDGVSQFFENYATEFNIPLDLLKAVAYAETRFYHNIPDSSHESCSGIPHTYGIMGLRNDRWFGNSLLEAAKLIEKNPDDLIASLELNIKGCAALLSKYADEININRNNLLEWKTILEKYSGIPQDDIKPFYSFDIFKVLSEGTFTNGIEIMPHPEIDLFIFDEEVNPQNKLKNIESEDYPPAVWDPSPNYTANAINQLFAVVHSTEGSFAGALSWLKNPSSQASSHYIIRSSDGYIVQLVRERNRAWHARCWNAYMLGVEHEGFVANPAYFTEAMYQSSAALFNHFATKYNIPVDRNRIVAHQEWQNKNWKNWMSANYPSIDATCNTHTDPGTYWKWDRFMSLITNQNQDVIHGFEYIVSPWWDPNSSGSTYGISLNSTFNQTNESKKSLTYSGKLILKDSSQSSSWFVRVYYNYSANDTLKLGTSGYLRISLKSSNVPTGLKVRLAVDDNSASTTEVTTWQTVIADGTWHLYEWKIEDPNQWAAWVGSSNGQIDGPNTYFDSIQFNCNDPNSGSTEYVIFIDNIERGTQQLNIINLNLTALLEGTFNSSTNKMIGDTVTILLRNNAAPFSIVDSVKTYLDSLGNCTVKFLNAPDGIYFIVIKNRNHLETWSRSGGETMLRTSTYTYNFTDNPAKAFGNNLKKVGSKWCVFAGDVNQDGFVNQIDLISIANESFHYYSGYRTNDLTGDNFIDLSDMLICDNNAYNSVNIKKP